jgi:hypothetical protein
MPQEADRDEEASERPAGDGEPPLAIRTRWVRERMQDSEVERLLDEAGAKGPAAGFEAVREPVALAVERIAGLARSTTEEIRRKAKHFAVASLASAAIGVAAIFIALSVPAYAGPAMVIAAAELVSVVVLRTFQRRLASDLLAVAELESRSTERLAAARTTAELEDLTGEIRLEMAGMGPAGTVPPAR